MHHLVRSSLVFVQNEPNFLHMADVTQNVRKLLVFATCVTQQVWLQIIFFFSGNFYELYLMFRADSLSCPLCFFKVDGPSFLDVGSLATTAHVTREIVREI